MKTQLVYAGLACAALSGCGGDNGASKQTEGVDYSHLQHRETDESKLEAQSNGAFLENLKNGIRLNQNRLPGETTVYRLTNEENSDAGTENSATNSNSLISSTNLQEQGVDEADRVKYDGSHLFISYNEPYWINDDDNRRPYLKIVKTDSDQATSTEVSRIHYGQEHNRGDEIYLLKGEGETAESVVTLSYNQYHFYIDALPVEPTTQVLSSSMLALPSWTVGTILMEGFDVTNTTAPEKNWDMAIDGTLRTSRRIGDILYLVTSFTPTINGVTPYPNEASTQKNNEALIEQATAQQLLPTYTLNGGAPELLVEPDNCLASANTDIDTGFIEVLTITAFDLNSQTVVKSMCLDGYATGVYSSQDNLYFSVSEYGLWDEEESGTVIHKFSLNGGEIEYEASGLVRGSVGWDRPHFRMSEKDERLRVVTTTRRRSDWEPEHYLSILNQDGGDLSVVAGLPNPIHPAPIGKPGEEIYAVRFFDDRAYIVTFEQIDPLYVIDLSNQDEPFIAGELEVPGFSSYLHPINNRYLFSVGVDVKQNRPNGIKVSLYNVTDISQPFLTDEYVYGENGYAHSDARNDHHAINFQIRNDEETRVTLPISISNDEYNNESDEKGLLLFELNNMNSNNGTLTEVGLLSVLPSSGPYNHYFHKPRSRLHNEAVYFINEGDVWSSFWETPELVNGPN